MKTDNELISEFYDDTTFDDKGFCTDTNHLYSWRPGVYDPLRIEHLRYHDSWNWLIPVIEKIVNLGLTSDIKNCAGQAYKVSHEPIGNEIPIHYKNVVEFIKWYNQNK
jgi:hypothetical protein